MPDETVETLFKPGYVGPAGAESNDGLLLNEAFEDLSHDSKTTLGDYLSSLTSDGLRGNYYKVNPGAIESANFEADGNPTKLVTGGPETDAAGRFMDDVNDESAASLEMYSDSGQFTAADPDDVKLSDFLDKRTQEQGHKLLTDIVQTGAGSLLGHKVHEVPGTAPVVQKKISGVLLNNRFNPGSQTPYIQDGEMSKSFAHNQGLLGEYNQTGDDITVDQLSKIGLSLMLRATGHAGSDPDSESTLSTMLPSLNQMMLGRIDESELHARNAMTDAAGMPERLQIPDTELAGTDTRKSYGVLNSYLEPFNGPAPWGMITLSSLGALGIIIISEAIGFLLGMLLGESDSHSRRNPEAPWLTYNKGQYTKKNWIDTANLFMQVPQLEFEFDRAMTTGIRSFFGFEGDGFLSALGSGMLQLAMSPGFYASVIRRIVQDAESIGTAIAEADIMTGPFVILEVLRSSATFRFIMVCAVIGDKTLQHQFKTMNPMGEDMDKIRNSAATRIAKSRIGSGGDGSALYGRAVYDGRLAWRHGSNNSRYVLPRSFYTAGNQFGMKKGQGARVFGHAGMELFDKIVDKAEGAAATLDTEQGTMELETAPVINGRLTPEYVHFIENQLELEYVPFYFQDLRTNEIISFHAFIESVSDGYSADYSSMGGYGRIDDVKIYNKTTRSVAVTFVIAATSPEDFDMLWWDVNKLTTLVYPQWSRGKQRKAGDKSFIQPFSQIPTASPVVRMRVGDLIKSNLTQFHLSRLFGSGIPDAPDSPFSIGAGSTKEKAIANAQQVVANIAEQRASYKLMRDPEYGYNVGDKAQLRPSSRPRRPHAMAKPPGAMMPLGMFDSKKNRVKTLTPVQVEVTDWKDIGSKDKPIYQYTVELKKDKSGLKNDYQFIVLHNDLDPDPDQLNTIVATAIPGASETGPESESSNPEDFFGDGNSIVRSFKSAAGRGLAGVITGMEFDWAEAMWSVDPLGSRAPMMMKVSITLEPIHDIPPGIDSDGFNRAPLYNTGRLMNGLSGDVWGDNFIDYENNPQKAHRESLGRAGEPVNTDEE